MRDISPAVNDGWHEVDPDAWEDLRNAMRDEYAASHDGLIAWPVRGYGCPAWSDGTSTWIAAEDALHAKGVESVSCVDDWHVDIVFSSGVTALLLTSDRLYVSEVES